MSNRNTYLIVGAILVLAAALYLGLTGHTLPGLAPSGPSADRVASVQKFLDDMCLNQSSGPVSNKPDVFHMFDVQEKCEYGIKQKATDIATLSDYELINRLTTECASNPGGINSVERIRMQLDAFGTPEKPGVAQSDQDFCRDKVRNAFPQFGKN